MILWRPAASHPGDWITGQRDAVLHQAPMKGEGWPGCHQLKPC